MPFLYKNDRLLIVFFCPSIGCRQNKDSQRFFPANQVIFRFNIAGPKRWKSTFFRHSSAWQWNVWYSSIFCNCLRHPWVFYSKYNLWFQYFNSPLTPSNSNEFCAMHSGQHRDTHFVLPPSGCHCWGAWPRVNLFTFLVLHIFGGTLMVVTQSPTCRCLAIMEVLV